MENYKLALCAKNISDQFTHHSVMKMIIKKLPETWKYRYYSHSKTNHLEESTESLFDWLCKEQMPYMKRYGTEGKTVEEKKTLQDWGRNKRFGFAGQSKLLENTLIKKCFCCKGLHDFEECEEANKWSAHQRYLWCREQKRCFRCFSLGHPRRLCRSKLTCKICNSNHHFFHHWGNINMVKNEMEVKSSINNNKMCGRPQTKSSPKISMLSSNIQVKKCLTRYWLTLSRLHSVALPVLLISYSFSSTPLKASSL